MTKPETLTENERRDMRLQGAIAKALRIIDAQAARIAELERADRDAARCIRGLSDERDAANARAEAAERALEKSTPAQYWKGKCEAAERNLTALQASYTRGSAASEAAALRAEVERLQEIGAGRRNIEAELRAEVERLNEQTEEVRALLEGSRPEWVEGYYPGELIRTSVVRKALQILAVNPEVKT
jgi:chromosome segregation ATPase